MIPPSTAYDMNSNIGLLFIVNEDYYIIPKPRMSRPSGRLHFSIIALDFIGVKITSVSVNRMSRI